MRRRLIILFFLLIFKITFAQDSIYTSFCEHNVDGIYTGYSKLISRYDSNGNLLRRDEIGESQSYWDPSAPISAFHNYTTLTYTVNNQIAIQVQYYGDNFGNFNLQVRHSYAYDANGNLIADTIINISDRDLFTYSWANNDTIAKYKYVDSSNVFILKESECKLE